MSYAQIRQEDNVVVNVILADQEWVEEHEGVDGFTYVKYVDEEGYITSAFNPYPGCVFDPETQTFRLPDQGPGPDGPAMELPPDDPEIEDALNDILGF